MRDSGGKTNRSMEVKDVTNKKEKGDNGKNDRKTSKKRRKRRKRNLSLETKNHNQFIYRILNYILAWLTFQGSLAIDVCNDQSQLHV